MPKTSERCFAASQRLLCKMTNGRTLSIQRSKWFHSGLALSALVRHVIDMTDLAKARAPILAAGGIVLREGSRPRIAIVRLRRDKSWVLPKGKLYPGEHARAAAKREVLEETGHEVSVHAFLGSLSYLVAGKIKIVQFWHMRAARRAGARADP